MWTHGHFYWNEFMTRDVEGVKAFYADTLGWTFSAMPMPQGTYHLVLDGEQPIAGIMPMTGPEFDGVPEHWFSYIAVDDIDARLEKAVAKGASIAHGPFDVEGVGRICVLKQPNGAMIGWMTPAPQS